MNRRRLPRSLAIALPLASVAAGAVFAARGVVIVWALARGADEESTLVVLRVLSNDPRIRAFAVDGVNPFTKIRVGLVRPSPLQSKLTVRVPRTSVAEHPRTEIRFAPNAERLWSGRPTFTVSYTGIPDKIPEFTSEQSLDRYLDDTIERARPR